MAFWNAPLDMKDHANRAVKSAVEMQKELKQLNKELKKEKLPEINIGIGINTGEALVGNMGSEQRFDYSVIGDDVNLASRLESSSKELGSTLVIGEKPKHRRKDTNTNHLAQSKSKASQKKLRYIQYNYGTVFYIGWRFRIAYSRYNRLGGIHLYHNQVYSQQCGWQYFVH